MRALTNTLTVRPPMVTGVVVAPVEAAPEMLCFFPAVACPARVSFPLVPCLESIPDAVASLGLTLRLCTGDVPVMGCCLMPQVLKVGEASPVLR